MYTAHIYLTEHFECFWIFVYTVICVIQLHCSTKQWWYWVKSRRYNQQLVFCADNEQSYRPFYSIQLEFFAFKYYNTLCLYMQNVTYTQNFLVDFMFQIHNCLYKRKNFSLKVQQTLC
jgi:hypothetical protein